MLNKLYSFCIQGNVEEAYAYLHSIDQSKQVKLLKQKYYNRFYKEQPIVRVRSKDPWIRKVILAYYHYFITVLTKKMSVQLAEEALIQNLLPLITTEVNEPVDINQIENELKLLFKEKGYYFLGGMTLPYYGPYIWKGMEKKEYQVELPNGLQEVTVFFMSDFILHSWLHFATFGARATGGWAKEDGLYCVNSRYENRMETHKFQVSFLKHEAQHLQDFNRFPGLPSKDLEYRAKLVELIYHPSQKLYKDFLLIAQEDSSSPHSYASFAILKNTLHKKMGSSTEICSIAKQLYNQHTEELLRLNGDYCKGVI